jgi:hypothetical protein
MVDWPLAQQPVPSEMIQERDNMRLWSLKAEIEAFMTDWQEIARLDWHYEFAYRDAI